MNTLPIEMIMNILSFLCKSELLLVVSRSYLPVYRSNVVWQLVVGKAPVAIPPKKEAWLPAIF